MAMNKLPSRVDDDEVVGGEHRARTKLSTGEREARCDGKSIESGYIWSPHHHRYNKKK